MGAHPSKTGPDPELSILLDPQCQPPFHPGSQISGLVIPTGAHPTPIRQASIALVGRAVSHITYVTESRNTTTGTTSRTTHRYHHDVPLFERSLPLCENAWVGGQYNASYRFEFTFPSSPDVSYGYVPYKATKAMEVKMEKSIFKDRRVDVERVYETTAQALSLPASFLWDDERTHEPNFARVEYGLQVRATFDEQPDYLSQLTELEFMPLQTPWQLTWNEACRKPELYTSSRLTGAEKSFRSSLKDKFSRHTPSVRHTIGINLPSHIERRFDVHAFVRLDEISGPEVDVPSVNIRLKKLTLTQVTSFRAFSCNLNWEYTDGRAEHETYRRDRIELHYDAEPVRAVRQDKSTFGGWLFPAKFEVLLSEDRRVVQGFRTCNVGVRWLFHAVVEVEIAGRGFEWEVWKGVEVVMGNGGERGGQVRCQGGDYEDRKGAGHRANYQGGCEEPYRGRHESENPAWVKEKSRD